MVIRVVDFAPAADTADHGSAVFDPLHAALIGREDQQIIVSFEGVQTATSSFVNVAFVQLLSTHSLAELKSRLRIVNSTRQINDMIRTRLEREGAALLASATTS
jgi:hypothetical protein